MPEQIPLQRQTPDSAMLFDFWYRALPSDKLSRGKLVKCMLLETPLVLGRDRKFVPDLRRADFRILENGVEQEIAFFAPVDRPFDVALIIDNSRSTDFELRHIKEAALAFSRPG